MKKIIVIIALITALFTITGCTEKDKKEMSSQNSSTANQKEEDKTSMVGYYLAYDAVQYGKHFNEEETKSENITLLIRDDNTATLKWGDSAGKDYIIEGDRFIAIAGDEEGKITYKTGKVKIELADGDYLSFKK